LTLPAFDESPEFHRIRDSVLKLKAESASAFNPKAKAPRATKQFLISVLETVILTFALIFVKFIRKRKNTGI
jgi:hypothetical protein